MNELVLLLQIASVTAMLLISLRLGKEALIAFLSLSGILANVFVLKQINLFGLTVTGSDAFMIGSILGLNMLQEFYGRRIARRAIVISFSSALFYTFISQIHLAFTPAVHDTAHLHYVSLFAPMPRILIASLTVYLLVSRIDYFLYGALKHFFSGKYLVGRNICSLALSQGIDTVLFSFLGLYGIVESVGSIILFSFTIKMIIIALSTPALLLSKKIARSTSTMFIPARRDRSFVYPSSSPVYEREQEK